MLYRLVRKIADHVHRHPKRLMVTVAVLLAISWGFAGYAFVKAADAAHQGRIDNCNSVNELSRKLYVTFADLGYSPVSIRKFLPTQHCEDIP